MLLASVLWCAQAGPIQKRPVHQASPEVESPGFRTWGYSPRETQGQLAPHTGDDTGPEVESRLHVPGQHTCHSITVHEDVLTESAHSRPSVGYGSVYPESHLLFLLFIPPWGERTRTWEGKAMCTGVWVLSRHSGNISRSKARILLWGWMQPKLSYSLLGPPEPKRRKGNGYWCRHQEAFGFG